MLRSMLGAGGVCVASMQHCPTSTANRSQGLVYTALSSIVPERSPTTSRRLRHSRDGSDLLGVPITPSLHISPTSSASSGRPGVVGPAMRLPKHSIHHRPSPITIPAPQHYTPPTPPGSPPLPVTPLPIVHDARGLPIPAVVMPKRCGGPSVLDMAKQDYARAVVLARDMDWRALFRKARRRSLFSAFGRAGGISFPSCPPGR